MGEVKKRDGGIELLRIICLLLIFWMHAAGSYEGGGPSAWISIAADVAGNIGVSCFILISGYYGIRLDVKKMIRLDLMLVFYSWSSLALSLAWGERLGGEAVISHIFPVIGKQSWFFTCYFALAFLSPFLNQIAESLGEIRMRQMLIAMLVIFSGITTVFFFDINGDGGKGIVHMVMVYMIGRYIALYQRDRVCRAGHLWAALLATMAINYCLNAALYVATGTVQNRYARDNTLFTVAEAVLAFLIFRSASFSSEAVERLARHVPGAFAAEWALRGIMTRYVFDYAAYAAEPYYEPLLLLSAAGLVAMGIAIDFLRSLLLSGAERRVADAAYGAGIALYNRARAAAEKRR